MNHNWPIIAWLDFAMRFKFFLLNNSFLLLLFFFSLFFLFLFFFLLLNLFLFLLLVDFLLLGIFFLCLLLRLVLQIKPDWHIKIALNSPQLMCPFENIEELDVDLWSIEGSIAFINLIRLSDFLQSLLQSCLCFVPQLLISYSIRRTSSQRKFIFKPEHIVDIKDKIEDAKHFLHYLISPAIDMRIILLETVNAS